jgi:N utilization substance protein A
MVTGQVTRYEGGTGTVDLGNVEAILPRSEQIPGETHHVNERVRTTVCEVRKAGSRVKVILSRTRPQLVQRLFEQEIPEIADGVIEINAMAREPGYRSKVAVSSMDQRVDCVGACVGVRGNRIKNIVDELAGERIDIVRWSDDLMVLIPNSLQPAEVEEVILCEMIGRAIVLVSEDQLSLAIGRRGQNVRLGSKLTGWDIEIMTRDELEETIERAVTGYCELPHVEADLSEHLVGEGYLSYDDLSVIEPDILMEMGGLTQEQVDEIVEVAESRAEDAEKAAVAERKRQREESAAKAVAERAAAAAAEAAGEEASEDDEDSTGEEGSNSDESSSEESAADENASEEGSADETATEEAATDESTAEENAAETQAEEPVAEAVADSETAKESS